jgi:hypothetical protein
MTKPIQLHVGYVGITREGKHVEIIAKDKRDTGLPWESKDEDWYTDLGHYWCDNRESSMDIIGPYEGAQQPLLEEDTPVETPVDYNDGKWHRWAGGGEYPVHPSSVVEVMFIDGQEDIVMEEAPANMWSWASKNEPITTFRVTKVYVEPPKVPREFWVRFGTAYNMPIESDAIHVREVLTDD